MNKKQMIAEQDRQEAYIYAQNRARKNRAFAITFITSFLVLLTLGVAGMIFIINTSETSRQTPTDKHTQQHT